MWPPLVRYSSREGAIGSNSFLLLVVVGVSTLLLLSGLLLLTRFRLEGDLLGVALSPLLLSLSLPVPVCRGEFGFFLAAAGFLSSNSSSGLLSPLAVSSSSGLCFLRFNGGEVGRRSDVGVVLCCRCWVADAMSPTSATFIVSLVPSWLVPASSPSFMVGVFAAWLVG